MSYVICYIKDPISLDHSMIFLFFFQLSAISKKIFDDCEKKLDAFNIIIIRQYTELEVNRQAKVDEANKSKGWFSGWFGSSSSSEEKDPQSAQALSKLLKNKNLYGITFLEFF